MSDTRIEDLAMLRAAISDLREALNGLSNFTQFGFSPAVHKGALDDCMEEVSNALAKLNYVRNNPNRKLPE